MRDEAGDAQEAENALDQALEVADHDQVVMPFTVDPVPALLRRHAGYRSTHAGLIAEIFDVLARQSVAPPRPRSTELLEPLTESETRVLRYLPTELSKREIAQELYLSPHTIKTHTKRIYAKLDTHNRRQAVQRAREYGLLGCASITRPAGS